MTTGERIKMIRNEHGMNQTEFAKEISVSTTTVCQLEVGKYNIARTTKKILCDRFKVNPVWLETGEGEKYVTTSTAEGLVPEIVSILNNNKSILNAVAQATKMFSVEDWKKLNDYISSLGEGNESDRNEY